MSSFYDVRLASYNSLKNYVQTHAPYKNSKNAYPLGERRYSDRHFRAESDESFSLWYLDRELVDNYYGATNDKHPDAIQNEAYYSKNMLGKVHPDNSFEFTSMRTSVGSNMILSEALGAHVHNDQSRGGCAYTRNGFWHPVFKGLRVDISSGKAVTPYTVFHPIVKRKEAREVMHKYAEFIVVFKTMIAQMTDRGISEVYEDLFNNRFGGDRDKFRASCMSDVLDFINQRDYMSAGCLFVSLRLNSISWRVEYTFAKDHPQILGNDGVMGFPHKFRENATGIVETRLREHILPLHEDVFTYKQLEQGEKVPASIWGSRIKVNGAPVIRI